MNDTDPRTPPLNGLILAGGKSTRMQQDKSRIEYHGKSQMAHLYALLAPLCPSTFISCSAPQRAETEQHFPVITDTFPAIGPAGGILSAFAVQPAGAWLVVACDLPYLSSATLKYLIANRDASRMATAFRNEKSGMPEPLVTIWEPCGCRQLLQAVAAGQGSPRKVLMTGDICLLTAPAPKELTNINYAHELPAVVAELAGGKK